MVLLIDNYDSFSYNLVQLVGKLTNGAVKVVRNDEITIEEIKELNPSSIILSPGPGKPENAGICMTVVKKLKEKFPILGVCLGHQSICEALGAKVTYAKELMHGKQSNMTILKNSAIFDGMEKQFPGARYHSLSVDADTIPEELEIIAIDARDNEVMAVKHKQYNVYGLQFHPESVLTPQGEKIIENFLNL